ncbi:MAG: SGNH/GDSL hydrolase family protein [Actinomycetota bacterium]|nr:SGNH/GDSL hydrolase family protein [Actinomycetota bacterium]
MATTFTYSNVSDRPTGPFLRTMGRIFPGVRAVQEQIAPYAAAWERDNAEALRQTGPLWVALGDSMTQGIGASSHRRGYVGQLSTTLAGNGWAHRLVNLSYNGARVQDVLERQLPALEQITEEHGSAALVTVIIGSNDIVLGSHRSQLVDRFADMLERLPHGSVVSNLPNPRREAAAIDTLLRDRDERGELVLADLRHDGAKSWRGRLAPDMFHPNDRGYREMAAAFERALSRAGLPRSP